jgi:hypothetical protein
MKHYFLTGKNQSFSVGPFVTLINTPERYFGQIIRSNDYSDYLSDEPFEYNLWSINSSSDKSNLLDVKYLIHENLSRLSENQAITHIGKFQGPINSSNKKLELITQSNIKYTLEFKINETILYCPSLTIEY